MRRFMLILSACLHTLLVCSSVSAADITGELKQWHKVTLTVDGPRAGEEDQDPNPFLDYRMTVEFTHESGASARRVPGYFAADGRAGESSAQAGLKWRAHLAPEKTGRWRWKLSFVKGKRAAVEENASSAVVAGLDGLSGSFQIGPSDKQGRDFRAKGRLEYVGKRYLQFAGTKDYFLKAGPDSPENFLAFADFDGTFSHKQNRPRREGEAAPVGLHRYEPHARDWRPGDPAWQNGKGKNIIGALNYIASRGCNAFSFLTYNVGGDGEDVWPFTGPENKLHYDCSKLDQWAVVFDHAQSLGLYLHFKMQEQEMDDNRKGDKGETGQVPAALDGGDLGVERKLYCRELAARFGHALALNWNLGEENTQSAEQQRAMSQYIRDVDPYDHHIVVHTFPGWQDRVYTNLLGGQSTLTGTSLQNEWDATHRRTLKWVQESERAGKPWVVANDEQGPANLGVPPDPGYQGHSGQAAHGNHSYDLNDIRKRVLWGNLMAGGAGVEYYFGYTLPQNDLVCEDWRSREKSWQHCRVALEFFHKHKIPFWEMSNRNALAGNPRNEDTAYCLAREGEIYLVYLAKAGVVELDLSGQSGTFEIAWFDPRAGGELMKGSVTEIQGGSKKSLGRAPREADLDWLVLARKKRAL